MTLEEIKSTLLSTIETGRIGTPVSLRLYVQLTKADWNLVDLGVQLLAVARVVFDSDVAMIQSQSNARQSQISVLAESLTGRTVSLTIGAGHAKEPQFDLLLVGNHGVARLEGLEDFDESSLSSHQACQSDAFAARLQQSIEESLSSDDALRVETL